MLESEMKHLTSGFHSPIFFSFFLLPLTCLSPPFSQQQPCSPHQPLPSAPARRRLPRPRMPQARDPTVPHWMPPAPPRQAWTASLTLLPFLSLPRTLVCSHWSLFAPSTFENRVVPYVKGIFYDNDKTILRHYNSWYWKVSWPPNHTYPVFGSLFIAYLALSSKKLEQYSHYFKL